MSRRTGPSRKPARAPGTELSGLIRAALEGGEYPPGRHGQAMCRRFGWRLVEKQKLCFDCGIPERQMRCATVCTRCTKGNAGERRPRRRLESVVFRSGFAATVPAGCQFVSHRHVLLSGRIANIAPTQVRPGDTARPTERALGTPHIVESLAAHALERPQRVAFDGATASASDTHLTGADDAPFAIDAQRVVEYYANGL